MLIFCLIILLLLIISIPIIAGIYLICEPIQNLEFDLGDIEEDDINEKEGKTGNQKVD